MFNWTNFYCREADNKKLTSSEAHYYFQLNALASRDPNSFVLRDLPSLSAAHENFFITNKVANRGIQCRFGMRGIIAESHYDTGRNMVVMLRGGKRYILNPPSECGKLGIIADVKHPSFRHSVFDWSNVTDARLHGFGDVLAVETVVRRGEVLYIPSFWLHYPISLGQSIQCNARSGTPEGQQGKQEIESCMGRDLDLKGYVMMN